MALMRRTAAKPERRAPNAKRSRRPRETVSRNQIGTTASHAMKMVA
jgi:hypothetical protein